MTANKVVCPACHQVLKAARPLRGGAKVRCPQCGGHFTVAADAVPLPFDEQELTPAGHDATEAAGAVAPASPPMVKTLLLAVGGTAAVMGLGIALVVYLVQRPKPAGPEAVPVVARNPQPKEEPEVKESERRRLEADRRKFMSLMIEAGTAMGTRRYADAAVAYEGALKLQPDDLDAAKGLSTARAALAPPIENPNDEQRKAEYANAMKQGQDALAAKQYAVAVRAYETALQFLPGDVAAIKSLSEAKDALAKDDSEQKKLAEYRDHMAAGQAAMVAQRYADAVREYVAAQRLMPDDNAALRARIQAEKRLADTQEEDKNRTAFNRLMDQAGAAQRNQRYRDAVRCYEDALKLFPGDRIAQQGLKDAKKGLKDVQDQFARLMALGDNAMQTLRYSDAVQAYGEAARLQPDNQAAQQGLLSAQKAADAASTATATYNTLITQGNLALRTQRYADAVVAFQGALALLPGDVVAGNGLLEATAGLEDFKRRRINFDRQMQAGSTALKQQRYAAAAQAFAEAARLFPDDLQATLALHQARYGQHMMDGQNFLTARRYADAVREFEQALVEMPGDVKASALLRQARTFVRN